MGRLAGSLVVLLFCVLLTAPVLEALETEKRIGSEPLEVLWIWSGAVSATSARVFARTRGLCETCSLLVSAGPSNAASLRFEPSLPTDKSGILRFELVGLESDTRYDYALEVSGELSETRGGLRTFDPGSQSFRFAFSTCAATGSESEVFRTILRHEPLFFLHLGDFHYANIKKNEVAPFLDAYDRVLSSSTQAELYRRIPVVYMWDDHDYGSDNADRTNPARRAARLAYQMAVPHYPLAAGHGDVPIYQSFEVGRVTFLVTDARSEKSPKSLKDDSTKSVLGAQQKDWLKRELLRARDQAGLIIWVNSIPWIASPKKRAEHWGAYSTEREEIALFIRENGIRNLAMLSGDAHMLAIDDGSNNTYGGRDEGFPIFHAGSLDRRGSVKGGPYSHGTFPGPGHFGLVEVIDHGERISVSWSGRDLDDQVILSYDFSVQVP